MVMSIKEEITALEEQLENTKGLGSVAKKKKIQAKINALKKEDALEPGEESEDEVPAPPTAVSRPGALEEAKLEQFPGRVLPKAKEWVSVTAEEVKRAQEDGSLVGFDEKKMVALIRGK